MRTAAIGTKSNVTILTRPTAYQRPELNLVAQRARRLTDKQAIASRMLLGDYRHGLPLRQRNLDGVIALCEAAPRQGGSK